MKLLDLPAELIVLTVYHSNIQEVHNFQLVSHVANEIIQNHHASIYRALAIHYGLARERQNFEQLFASRKLYFDWLKEPRDDEMPDDNRLPLVDGWREYVKRHFLLERSWKEAAYMLRLRFDSNGAHRIQVDEVEGTILSTRTAGSLRSECMKDDMTLWMHFQSTAPPWAHCEFANGFLIWGHTSKIIEVWRRDSDQINDPLPGCNPAEAQQLQYTLSQRQALAAACTDDSSSDSDTPEPKRRTYKPNETADLVSPIRGCFQPFALLNPPIATSASRYVHPHLVLCTRFLESAYIYDIPTNRLVKTITLQPPYDGRPSRVYYVEHSRAHVFVCTEDAVYVYGKDDGRLFATVRADVMPHVRLRVADEYSPHDPPPVDSTTQKMKLWVVGREHAQYLPSASGEFYAVHVSPCGGIWVIMNERDYILVITGGSKDPTQLTVVSIFLGDPELVYLAFDGHHIAVAGSKGIYVISLNRYRDPELSEEAALTSLVRGHVQLIPLPHVDMHSTSCLQITETAIWHVARRSLQEFGSVITNLDFSNLPEV